MGVSVRGSVRVNVGVEVAAGVGAEVATEKVAEVAADVGVFLCVCSRTSDGGWSTWLLSGIKAARTANSIAKKASRATTSTKATGRAVVLASTLSSLSESLPQLVCIGSACLRVVCLRTHTHTHTQGRCAHIFAPMKLTRPMLARITRRELETLILRCHTEHRPPAHDDVHPPRQSKVEYRQPSREGTGLLGLLCDDLLVEVLKWLPFERRVLFTRAVAKSFVYLVQKPDLFRSLHITPRPSVRWGFLNVKVHTLSIKESIGRKVQIPTNGMLDQLRQLELTNTSCATVGRLRTTCAPWNLTAMSITRVRGVQQVLLLLKWACSLETLVLTNVDVLYHLPVVIDAWRKKHGGYPPLRCLCMDKLNSTYMLEKLDLEELKVRHISTQVCVAKLPSMKRLFVRAHGSTLCSEIGVVPLRTLVDSCPELEELNVTVRINLHQEVDFEYASNFLQDKFSGYRAKVSVATY